jgi:hypothetical protein
VLRVCRKTLNDSWQFAAPQQTILKPERYIRQHINLLDLATPCKTLINQFAAVPFQLRKAPPSHHGMANIRKLGL